MKQFIIAGLVALAQPVLAQTSQKEQDKAAIRQMEGCYKVTFSFSETFSAKKDYEYHDKKFDQGIEYVKIIEETEDKIVLQHLLVVSDSMIVKHWRQDWVYENRDLLVYDKDQTWKNIQISEEEAKGTWTQKIFQVDDSPRYEGYGTWVHVDGRHFWEAKADAPLPRREHTKRDDYNVMGRFSHIEIFNDGWVLEQDNDKIVRSDSGDEIICAEKGIERFYTGEYNCQPAIDYWNKHQEFWKVVREVWTEKLAKGTIHLELMASGNIIYMRMFELAEETSKAKKFDAKKVRSSIVAIIDEHITIK